MILLSHLRDAVCKTRLKDALSEAHDLHQLAMEELDERERINRRLAAAIKRQRREWAQIFYEEMQHAERLMRR